MQRLLILVDEPGRSCRWALFDDATVAPPAWSAIDDDAIGTLAAANAAPPLLVVAQERVLMTAVELPEKASRQVLQSIEYQVEERLAGDVDDEHVAIGDTSQNPVPVAIVSRSVMERCRRLIDEHGLRVSRIVPELYLCPWTGDGVALLAVDDGWLLRYGASEGIKCDAAGLENILPLLGKPDDVGVIAVYHADASRLARIAGYRFEFMPAAAVADAGDADVINLQQRDYQASSPWRMLATAWKWILLLFATLVVVTTYNRAIALQTLEAELADIRDRQYQLLRPYLPPGTATDANLKKLLIERLGAARSNARERDFLQLLTEFTRARAGFAAIDISRISFQGDRLSLDLASAKLADIEALLEALRRSGANAELENLNIKPDRSAGRLVMRGGDDG